MAIVMLNTVCISGDWDGPTAAAVAGNAHISSGGEVCRPLFREEGAYGCRVVKAATEQIAKAHMTVLLVCILDVVEVIIFTQPSSKGRLTVALLLHRVPQIVHVRF